MRRVLKWTGLVLLGLFALIGVLLAALDSAPGHAFLLHQIGGFRTASGLSARIERLDGSIYGRMRLVGLELRDPMGPFFRSPSVTVDWRPFAYLTGKVDVRELASPEMRLIRRPELEAQPAQPGQPLLPDIDLVVGRLTIGRLVLEPAVTGRRHAVALNGSADLIDGRVRIDASGAALAGTGLAGGDRLRVRIDLQPSANRLILDAKLSAPAGGLVDSYSGFGKPIDIAIDGRGDWSAWDGRAVGSVAGQSLMDFRLAARNGQLSLQGAAHPALLAAGAPARWLEPELTASIRAQLMDRAANITVEASTGAGRVRAKGLVDLGRNRFGALRIDADLLTTAPLGKNANATDARFGLTLDGPFQTPDVAYDLTAAQLVFGDVRIDSVAARGKTTLAPKRTVIPIDASVRRITGLEAAAGGALANLTVKGDLIYAGGRFASENLKLRSDRIDATAIVLADPATGMFAGALKGRVTDYEVQGLGRLALTADAKLTTETGGGLGIAGSFKVETKRLDNPALANLLGGQAVASGRLRFASTGALSLDALRLGAPKFKIEDGRGSYSPTGRIDLQARAVSDDYGPLQVAASGTLQRPSARLTAPRPGLGSGLADLVVDLVGTADGYRVRASGRSDYGPLSADALVRLQGEAISIRLNKAEAAEIEAKGFAERRGDAPFVGEFTLAGRGLMGDLRLSDQAGLQRGDLDLAAKAARLPGATRITVGEGQLRATGLLHEGSPELSGSVDVSGLRSGGVAINRARARFSYRDGQGTAALVTDGRASTPFTFAGQAKLDGDRLVANARGSLSGVAVSLAAPAVATRQGKTWSLAETTIRLPRGALRIQGDYGPETRLHVVLDEADLGVLRTVSPTLTVDGLASGELNYRARDKQAPTIDAILNIKSFRRSQAAVVSVPLDLSITAKLSQAGGELDAAARRGAAVLGRAHARVGPLRASPAAWIDDLMRAPLAGGFRYNGPAEVLWTFAGVEGQDLSGAVAVAADFGGTAARPNLEGVVRAKGLRYENQLYGTVISDLTVDGRFTQSRLELTEVNGRAGSGTVSARGYVGFDSAGGFPIDISATLDRAQLARSDNLDAAVTGTLHVTNAAATGALISGDLRIPEARYQFVREGAAEVIELEGVRRKGEGGGSPKATPDARPAIVWRLDVRVRAANQVFVSGLGLEAEWRTDLRIVGAATDPRVVGTLQVVRGTYSFAGKRFDLSNSSRVTFDGGPVANPQLSISADTTVEGITATINIGGRALAPQIAFTSTPSLPQDEVLARLLFGTSITSLSPTEALQLAAALNSLRGAGGGLNPLGRLRAATGFDRLRVVGADATTGQGTSLALGRYISKGVYVEVITDARGFTATQIEIALTRTLSLLSQTSSFGGSNLSLRYSKDY